jgi:HSP20 family molecular chaperone IbpA
MVLTAIDSFFNNFFYSFPNTEPKPPMTAFSKFDKDNNFIGVTIQFALVGFKKENIQVSCEGNVLHIEGSNLHNTWIGDKFQCSFSRKISVKENLNLKKADILFSDGLLDIFLPVVQKEANQKTVLFGNK